MEDSRKYKLIEWLADDVKLVTKEQGDNFVQNFPEYCRNGVLFADLLNRLKGGRSDAVIRGINRNPRNLSAVNANFEKVFSYLKA